MPYSSGTFQLYTPGNPVVTGTTISSTWANNTLNDIATGLSACLLKDGSQTVTANIPFSGFKITGLGAGTASGNSIRYEQVNGVVTTAGDLIYASGAGAFSRLAIGTADLPLVVNAGATAPQWGFATKTANTIYAGPSSGAAAAPSFRALVGAEASMVLISTASASTSATVDFTSGITSTYDTYIATFTNVIPATDDSQFYLRVSQSGTFKSGGADYRWGNNTVDSAAGTSAASGVASDSKMILSNASSSTASAGGINGYVIFNGPASATGNKAFRWNLTAARTVSVTLWVTDGGGQFILNSTAIDGIRFLMSAGNITSGNFALYGVRKA